mmetsp:Transcript_24252/g.66881  ORF Transcript_24252/g.66881 Transcript_24252/m.66881 type:complete len:175 (+) Transcript_24252:1503-2027(+)
MISSTLLAQRRSGVFASVCVRSALRPNGFGWSIAYYEERRVVVTLWVGWTRTSCLHSFLIFAPSSFSMSWRQLLSLANDRVIVCAPLRPSLVLSRSRASTVVLVGKKDGSVRFCVDCCDTNSKLRISDSPLPLTVEAIDRLSLSRGAPRDGSKVKGAIRARGAVAIEPIIGVSP